MGLPKYMKKKDAPRKKGQKGEKQAKETLNSGATWFSKGDLKYENCLVEVKKTDKKSFRITTQLIKKIINEAYTVKKEPVIMIEFPEYELIITVRIR